LKARRIIEENMVEVPVEVLCEVVFVLSSVYKVGHDRIGLELIGFFNNTLCELHHREAVTKGLELFTKNNLDFVDCILAGYKIIYGAEIFTFDKKLLRVMDF
jgi:predicted nucleic-acid-binding protein